MKILTSIGLLACSLCFTAGCNRQNLPKSDFKASIENYYQAHPSCLWDTAQTFPAKAKAEDAEGNGYDALVDAGLLTRTAATHHESNYQLAPQAQPFWVSDPNHPGAGNLCYGHRQVVSVDNASPPPTGPGSVTIVSYHYTVAGEPAWASAPAVQSAFPRLNNSGATRMSIATLTDTSKGWQMNPPPGAATGQSASADGPAGTNKTTASD